jgi:hypothetical protein
VYVLRSGKIYKPLSLSSSRRSSMRRGRGSEHESDGSSFEWDEEDEDEDEDEVKGYFKPIRHNDIYQGALLRGQRVKNKILSGHSVLLSSGT